MYTRAGETQTQTPVYVWGAGGQGSRRAVSSEHGSRRAGEQGAAVNRGLGTTLSQTYPWRVTKGAAE